MKTAVNSTTQYFESRYQIKMSSKISLSFVAHPPQSYRPVKFLKNGTETIFSNFTNIRYFV